MESACQTGKSQQPRELVTLASEVCLHDHQYDHANKEPACRLQLDNVHTLDKASLLLLPKPPDQIRSKPAHQDHERYQYPHLPYNYGLIGLARMVYFLTHYALPIVPQRNGRDVLSARIAAEIQAEADAELDLIALKSLFIQPFNTEPTDHLQKLKLLRLNLLKIGIRPNEITEVILPKDTKVIHPSWHAGLSLNTGGIVVYEEKIIDSKTSLEKLMQSARSDERNYIDSEKIALDTRCIAQKLPDGITRYFLPGLQYSILLESLTDELIPSFSALNKTLPIPRLG